MPKKHRLLKKQVEMVIKEGKTINSSFFSVKVLKNQENKAKIAFIAPKKMFKKAVLRNKAKRKLREMARSNIQKMVGFDVVFMAKQGLNDQNKAFLLEEFSNIKIS